jgi:hypothetical protein
MSAAPPAAFELGDVVWWHDDTHAGLYRRGEVLGATARGLLRVALEKPATGGDAVVEVPLAQLLAANPAHLESSDDLGDLSVLNPASMLCAVGSRFRSKPHEQIYTRAGALLLSVNPYREVRHCPVSQSSLAVTPSLNISVTLPYNTSQSASSH